MKTSIFKLFAASLLAAIATSAAAEAGARYVNHGRAGYVYTPQREQSAMRDSHRQARGASTSENPAPRGPKLQTAGRAGYRYVNRSR